MVFSLTLLPALLSLLPPTVSRGLRQQMRRSGDLGATGWAASLLSRLGAGRGPASGGGVGPDGARRWAMPVRRPAHHG